MVGGSGCPCRRCCQRWGKILNIVSSAAKSKRSAAAVQSVSLRAFRGGGGRASDPSMAWEGIRL